MICDQCDRESARLSDWGDAGWLCDECAAEEAEFWNNEDHQNDDGSWGA